MRSNAKLSAIAVLGAVALWPLALLIAACGDPDPEPPDDSRPPSEVGDPPGDTAPVTPPQTTLPPLPAELSGLPQVELLVTYLGEVLEERIAAFPAELRGNGCLGECEYADNVLNPAAATAIRQDLAAVGIAAHVLVFEMRTFGGTEQLIYKARVIGDFPSDSASLLMLISALTDLETVLFAAIPVPGT